MRQGFTLIESLIVLAVLSIVMVLSFNAFSFLGKKSDIDSTTNNVFSILALAKNKTLASEQEHQYGIYFDLSADPDEYTLFQGENYASRNSSFDEIHVLPTGIELASVSFNLLGSQVVFNRLRGDTNNFGSVIIHSLKNNETKTIYVYDSGEVSFQEKTDSGTGRISDSRHVHFDLGWSIANATALKFDFINAGQIKQITMADYFSIDDFDWAGEFTINNAIQEFRIHTHQLNPVTQLCIHRDRNNGKNNEEVYIYIVQGGVEKQIAHYDNDSLATVYKGNDVWDQMQQQ